MARNLDGCLSNSLVRLRFRNDLFLTQCYSPLNRDAIDTVVE
jgi:hypothetical protein